jgi:hypothetical protein
MTAQRLETQGPGNSRPSTSDELPVLVPFGSLRAPTETDYRDPETVADILLDFTTSLDNLRLFKSAGEPLFNRRLFPGFTPHRALEVLVEGMQLDKAQFEYLLDPASSGAVKMQEDFSSLTEFLFHENRAKTATRLWDVPGLSDLQKIALQWEIQHPRPIVEAELIAQSALETTEKLKVLDEELKKNAGSQVLFKFEPFTERVVSIGLGTLDGQGIVTQEESSSNPFRSLSIAQNAAMLDRGEELYMADRLIVPFEARLALFPVTDPDDWDLTMRRTGGMNVLDFDPEQTNYTSIAFGKDFDRLSKWDAGFKHLLAKLDIGNHQS